MPRFSPTASPRRIPRGVLLAKTYNNEDPSGYWMSEKLDGIRATWDGQTLRKAYRPHLPRGRSRFGRERPGKTRRKSRPKVARRQGRAAKPKKPPTPRKPSVPGRTGSLHRALGIPAGRKLPVAGLKRVARGRGKLAERARRALNLRGVKTKNMRSA